MNCRHCYSDCSEDIESNELDIDAWIRFADQVIEDGVIQFYIEGGEPLMKPGILRFISHISRRAMVLLRTHGTLIDAAVAAALKSAGVGRVLIDVMGADADGHDWFTRAPGSFEASRAGIANCARAGIATDILVILTRQTAPRLNDILGMAAELGAERVGVLRLYPLGRAKDAWPDLALSLDEQMAALASLRPPPGVKVMQSWHPNDHNCCWQAAAVDATGRAIGCMYLREYVNYGDIARTRYLDIWRHHPLYRHLRAGKVEQSCPDCSASQHSHGGCRSTAFAFHGRWDAPDPFDAPLNNGVDLRVLARQ
jgi:radical SAM protein with 4Fe4S-binding SPASM domain